MVGGSQGIRWGAFLLACHQMRPQCSALGPSYPQGWELGQRWLQKGTELERGNWSRVRSTMRCFKQNSNSCSCHQVASPTLAHGP